MRNWKKSQKTYKILHEKIGENINSQRHKKYDYEYGNDYNFSELDYNKLDAFNQLNDH